MSLVNWAAPTTTLSPWRSGFDDLFDDLESSMLGNVGGSALGWPTGRRRRGRGTSSALTPFAAGGSMMQMDMYEQPDKYEVVMDMPGVQKEDINISVDDQSNTLTVTTERKEQSDRDESGWVTRERSWGKSVRSMALPNTADLQNAEVELRNGQLHMNVPKRESPTGRKLTIK